MNTKPCDEMISKQKNVLQALYCLDIFSKRDVKATDTFVKVSREKKSSVPIYEMHLLWTRLFN